uniref:uncharacterized protein LOC101290966 n=1 Tax=Fragaria vesca subsp. vesca TaxID=101020 RepID=UPI0005C9FC1E|nr:PREDICTED: uncharacterized protein LOC101290966 [Fragaria vesca subsp. vesca]
MNGSGSGSWGEDGKGYKVVLDVMPHGRRIKRMKKSFKQRRNGAMSQTDNGVKIETAALGFLRAEATHSDAVELGLFTFDKKHGRLARLAWQSSSHQIHLRRTSYRLSSESKQLGRRSLCSVLFPRVRYSGGDVFRSAEVHPPPPFRRTTPLPLLRVSPKDLRSFVWTVVSYMFKDTLKLPPSSSQIVFSISFFSWSIKPLYRIFLLNLVCIGHVLDSEGDYVEALKAFIDSHRYGFSSGHSLFGASMFLFTLDSLMRCCIRAQPNYPPRCMYLIL